jgi:hypothetical protein
MPAFSAIPDGVSPALTVYDLRFLDDFFFASLVAVGVAVVRAGEPESPPEDSRPSCRIE